MKIRGKFWIEKDGEKVFGEGPCILLEMVGKLGNLNKASDELNMSYSKAWSIINKAEEIFGYTLLETKVGGADGGSSCLTDKAKTLIKVYNSLSSEAEIVIEELFEKHAKNL